MKVRTAKFLESRIESHHSGCLTAS
jgi:hypothetical protein